MGKTKEKKNEKDVKVDTSKKDKKKVKKKVKKVKKKEELNKTNWRVIVIFVSIAVFGLVYVAMKPLLDNARASLSEAEIEAMDLYHQEKFHLSVRAFEKIPKDEMSILSLNSYGIALHALNRTKEAAVAFRLASEKDADSFRSLINLAQMLQKSSPDEALRIYKQIVQLHKVCVRSWQEEEGAVESKFCDKLKMMEGEYSNFKKVVIESIVQASEIFAALGETHREEQLSVLKYGVKVDENAIRVHFLLGRLYLILEDIVAATTHFKFCSEIEMDMSNPNPRLGTYKGACAGLLQKIDAINERKIKALDPNAVRKRDVEDDDGTTTAARSDSSSSNVDGDGDKKVEL